jgi:hypothetical protein
VVFSTCGGCRSVLLCYAAADDAQASDVKARLDALREFAAIDTLNCAFATPTSAQLTAYGAVLLWSHVVAFHDAALLGDALADYVDAGRTLVVAGDAFGFRYGTTIGGRFAADNYLPVVLSTVRSIVVVVVVVVCYCLYLHCCDRLCTAIWMNSRAC